MRSDKILFKFAPMKKSINITKKQISSLGLVFCMVIGLHFYAVASKGDGKSKKGYVLKFNGFELKNKLHTDFILRPEFVYKGSFSNIETTSGQTTIQSVITYQKGNTTFIYPYKHKVRVPKFVTPTAPSFR